MDLLNLPTDDHWFEIIWKGKAGQGKLTKNPLSLSPQIFKRLTNILFQGMIVLEGKIAQCSPTRQKLAVGRPPYTLGWLLCDRASNADWFK